MYMHKISNLIIYAIIEFNINLKDYFLCQSQSVKGKLLYPYLGSKAMALGCSMAPAISVVRREPSSLATSIWSRLLSIQYMLPAIQSTVSPSGVAKPCSTTTSTALTPTKKKKGNQLLHPFKEHVKDKGKDQCISSTEF